MSDLHHDDVTADPDARIANLVAIATREIEAKRASGDATDPDIGEAETHLWVLRSLQHARAHLTRIAKGGTRKEMRSWATLGLALAAE